MYNKKLNTIILFKDKNNKKTYFNELYMKFLSYICHYLFYFVTFDKI